MSFARTVDANYAAAHAAYAFSDCAAIYPITPSSVMAELMDGWAAQGKTNLSGNIVSLRQLQSEAGAAGALHGMAITGAVCSTFTASQGLLLMIPDMYKLSGELLPCVFHVSARALSTHALSIFGDQSDVMACRQTGFAMLCASSVQEAADFALCAHIATLRSSVPFLHFFDGFRTSHELQRISLADEREMAALMPWESLKAFRRRALNPQHPYQSGTAQNPDIYFQNREACNTHYAALPALVQAVFADLYDVLGRRYHLVDYVGAPDAQRVLVCMGSGCETAQETVEALCRNGEKVGLVKVRLFRPFPAEQLAQLLPETVQAVAVLDRSKEPGGTGEALYTDVCTALMQFGRGNIRVLGGRYGLGGKEFTPGMAKAALDNLREKCQHPFTVGITDDVTCLSLPWDKDFHPAPACIKSCLFYGLGSDGTVGTVKRTAQMLGQKTDLNVQAFFSYDSKKSGGVTASHLRYGPAEIHSTYLIDHADFIACHHPGFLTQIDLLSPLMEGGTFLLNCPWSDAELDDKLPGEVKRLLHKRHARLRVIDASALAEECGISGRIGAIMQAAFFSLTELLPGAAFLKAMEQNVRELYGRKGDEVVESNLRALRRAASEVRAVDIPASWADAPLMPPASRESSDYFDRFARPILRQEGDSLPVSAMNPGGCVPTDTAQFEKRGIARRVPKWIQERCIQCGLCSLVCPHGCIRPFTVAEGQETPKGFTTIPSKEGGYRIQVSPMDCTGCGCCVNICPAKGKALELIPYEDMLPQQHLWDFAQKRPAPAVPQEPLTVRSTQAVKPLFAYSGACAGCGETPYIKLLTQLFGPRLVIANATGCTSIFSGSAPSCPYAMLPDGRGPAWASSLFEDNAEFGYGMAVSYAHRRAALADSLREIADKADCPEALRKAIHGWVAGMDHASQAEKAANTLLGICRELDTEDARRILLSSDLLPKPSIWLLGGDGWAYDIGFGGLDHVLAQHIDLNVLVLDTEVYSNTGGQSSKATPVGAQAKFAMAGKHTEKKDLGRMMMTYGHVYVAQVAMGANPAQLIRAMTEAEAYAGPSLVIAYATCISHGLPSMGISQQEMKRAVDCGYWPLYRYHPEKSPRLTLDSPAPKGDYQAFLEGETRFAALLRQTPEAAHALLDRQEAQAKARLEDLRELGARPI